MNRLPIIRHLRYFYLRYRVNQHYDMWGSVGMLPVHAHRDYEVLDQIWRASDEQGRRQDHRLRVAA